MIVLKNAPAFLFVSLSLNAYSQKKLPAVQAPVFKKYSFNIIKFGAKPDGKTLNTHSIKIFAPVSCCDKEDE